MRRFITRAVLLLCGVIVSLQYSQLHVFAQQDSPERSRSEHQTQSDPSDPKDTPRVTGQPASIEEATKLPGKRSKADVTIDELRERLDEIERTTRAEIEALRRLIQLQQVELAGLRQQAPALQPVGPEQLADTQVEGQASTLGALPQSVAGARAAETSAQVGPQTSTPKTTSKQLPEGEISGAAQRTTFRRDNESVARTNNKPLGPSRAGFFDIPGTPAQVKIDGYFKLDGIIDPRPAGDPEQFNTAKIPISQPGQPQPSSVSVFARQTRFNLDFHSALGKSDDEVRVFLEFDFFGGQGETAPRLRHAYGQYKNLLLGYTWSTFTDPDAFPDTLDFEMPAGVSDVRQAQVRFTLPLSHSNTLAFAVERPVVSAARTLVPDGKTYNPAPDSIIRWRYENKVGHLQVGTLLRAVGYQDNTRQQTMFGYAVKASAGLQLPGMDSLQLVGMYGKGYGRYIKNINSYDIDLDNSGTRFQAMPAVAAYLGYTHHWLSPLRSTVTFGYDRVQNTAAQPGTAFSKSYYTSGNLVWNPMGHLHLGVEFLHGWQVLRNASQGNANRIQFSAKYDLYRKE